MSDQLNFRVSSALKDIIGRDLITDDYIAVFELVKNSYDAYATQVDIFFVDIHSESPKIVIRDNGKGMNFDDLNNKWLFVAYSAKKEGTEDSSFDYRDQINQNRFFAGAKGIGRFSCDRLGKHLYLETIKQEPNPKVEVLITDWEKFESDVREDFIDVKILHETRPESTYGLIHGTVLEITGLRSEWDRPKLLKLKDSLAKLISPKSSSGSDNFRIFIHSEDELNDDAQEEDERRKVNGPVINFIFEALGLKTTKIVARVSENSDYLETELMDGGTLIYYIKERNLFSKLRGIEFTLYYLNKAAKLTFARRMGLAARRYGHIFLYKNGFRIYPFGEPFEDPLKIDVRKSRRQYSFLGTGELMGQIDIKGVNPELKETSSRGNGLIRNKEYEELESCFFLVLERLEKYVVEVQQWGLSIEDGDVDANLHERIINLIEKLTGSTEIIDIQYADNFIEILKRSQSSSADSLIQNLGQIAFRSNNQELIENTKRLAHRVESLKRAKEESDQEAKEERRNAKEASQKLEQKESENLFLRSVKSQDFDEIVSFLHHIGISASIVDNFLTGLFNRVREGEAIEPSTLAEILKLVVFENKKIQNISTFATKANFKLYTDAIEVNLDEYLKEYILNVVQISNNDGIKIDFINKNPSPYIGKFRPIEINILVDNFFSNSKKAGATEFVVSLQREGNGVVLSFRDNGKGIPQGMIDDIFKYGFTTNIVGSGLGLFHVREIVDRMGGDLMVESIEGEYTEFKIHFK
jgi:signal transduction histidine kinase